MARDTAHVLESIQLDVEELIENLRFDYQHSPNYVTNSTAFDNLNRTSGDWVMSCCPSHPETRASFGVSINAPYHCHCFYCGSLGTIDKVIEDAFQLDAGEGIAKLLSGFLVEEKRTAIDIEGIINDGRETVEIPSLPLTELTKFNHVNKQSLEYLSAYNYMVYARGISPATLELFEIQFDTDNHCVVFPQYTRECKLRFLQKRKVGDNYYGAKFINEGLAIKKDILFGLHFVERSKYNDNRIKRIRLVESPIDAMSNVQVGIPAAAINGKILFKHQIRELQLAGIEIVDLFFDNDSAGQEATQHATDALLKAGFVVNHVLHPPHTDHAKSDSNSLLLTNQLHNLNTMPTMLQGLLNRRHL